MENNWKEHGVIVGNDGIKEIIYKLENTNLYVHLGNSTVEIYKRIDRENKETIFKYEI